MVQPSPTASCTSADQNSDRRLVFISHANPDDNEFVSWLGSRLVAAGYDAWSDILQLVGGEPFWSDIGNAIRNQAAAVVLALSRAAYQKPGVLNEIALADSTGRRLSDPKFIIPLRLDDLPFDQFPEQVIRLNAIEFGANWACGLQDLLEALNLRAIPRREGPSTQLLDEFRSFRERQSASVTGSPEILESNWLRIKSLPHDATFSRFGADSKTVRSVLARFQTPIVPWERLGFGFASPAEIVDAELPGIAVEHGYTVDLERFLAGEASGPTIRRGEASRMMSNLLRQAWERFAASKGLCSYEFANYLGWYVPKGLIDNDTIVFEDISGKRRRKRLVGRSEKRRVHWHFAVTARPVVGSISRFELRPQIVFTEDGKTPLDSKPKMARLRRSFCKNWWNDRWRTLLRAFVQFLSDGNDEIRLPLGGTAKAILHAELTTFEAQISISNDAVSPAEE